MLVKMAARMCLMSKGLASSPCTTKKTILRCFLFSILSLKWRSKSFCLVELKLGILVSAPFLGSPARVLQSVLPAHHVQVRKSRVDRFEGRF